MTGFHQFLLSEPVSKFNFPVDEHSHDVVELLHVFVLISFIDVVDQWIFCQTRSSDQISSPSRATLRVLSVIAFVARFSAVRLLSFSTILGRVTLHKISGSVAVVLCSTW